MPDPRDSQTVVSVALSDELLAKIDKLADDWMAAFSCPDRDRARSDVVLMTLERALGNG